MEQALAERARTGEDRQRMLEVILGVLADESIPDEVVGGLLRDRPGRQNLADAQADVWADLPRDHGRLRALAASYPYLRQFRPDVLAAIDFHGGPGMGQLMEAVSVLRELNRSGRRKVPQDAPTGFVPRRYAGYLARARRDGDDAGCRHYWELCTLLGLRDGLRSGDVFVPGSRCYADPGSYLIAPARSRPCRAVARGWSRRYWREGKGESCTGRSQKGAWAGWWWLPGSPGSRVPGVLTLTDQADLVLDLIEGIAERPLAEDSDVGDPGGGFTIHGEVKGEFVSLLGCWVQLYAERRWGSADAVVTQIRALRAVLGVHIADEDEAAFSAVTLNASGLTQWSLPAIRRTPGSSDGLRETLVLGDAELRGGRLRLIHSESRRFSNTGFGRESASTAASLLTFRTGEPLSLRDLLDVPFAVECMLAFAMQRTLPESVLDLEPSKNWPGASSLSEWQSVVILDGWHQVKTADVRFAHQMLFSAYDGDPIELIQRWFEVWDRWGSALKLYLSLLRGSGEFLESRVLSAIRAAEAAAETVGCNRARVSPSEHETLRDAVTNAVPIQHREWIRSTFPRNEHGLRQRLAALVVRLDPQAQAALVPDARKWSKEAAEVRGRLAHEGSDEKREPQHLVAVGEVTGAVVALTVMNELQLDALCLRRAVQGDGPLVRTASLGQRFYRS